MKKLFSALICLCLVLAMPAAAMAAYYDEITTDVSGNMTITRDTWLYASGSITVYSGQTLTIAKNVDLILDDRSTLTVNYGGTLVIEGTLNNNKGGTFTNAGTVTNDGYHYGAMVNSGYVTNYGDMDTILNTKEGSINNTRYGEIYNVINNGYLYGDGDVKYMDGGYLGSNPVNGYYQITVSAGKGGAVWPDGTMYVKPGATTETMRFTPEYGYEIAGVYVDGEYVGAYNTYVIRNVDKHHKVEVKFVQSVSSKGYEIKITASAGGTVTPSGYMYVAPGKDSEQVVLTPNNGYSISAVYVDGQPVELSAGYIFPAVYANHTMEVFFAPGTTGGGLVVEPPQTGDGDGAMAFGVALLLSGAGMLVYLRRRQGA